MHYSRSSSAEYGKSFLSQLIGNILAVLIVFVPFLDAMRSEEGDDLFVDSVQDGQAMDDLVIYFPACPVRIVIILPVLSEPTHRREEMPFLF